MSKVNFLHPDYLEKRSLHRSLRLLSTKYPFKGRLLDIGCGNKPYAHLFDRCEYIGIDFRDFSRNESYDVGKPDIYFSKEYRKDFLLRGIKEGSLDIVASFQVLEHHKAPGIFFKECHRILKKGGYIIITVPFIWELHEIPNDYYRFTEFIIRSLCEDNGFKIVETIRRGGVFSAANQMMNNHFFNNKSILSKIAGIPFLLLQPLSAWMDSLCKEHKAFLGYAFLVKKVR